MGVVVLRVGLDVLSSDDGRQLIEELTRDDLSVWTLAAVLSLEGSGQPQRRWSLRRGVLLSRVRRGLCSHPPHRLRAQARHDETSSVPAWWRRTGWHIPVEQDCSESPARSCPPDARAQARDALSAALVQGEMPLRARHRLRDGCLPDMDQRRQEHDPRAFSYPRWSPRRPLAGCRSSARGRQPRHCRAPARERWPRR